MSASALTLAQTKAAAEDPAFEHALGSEIAASEEIRMRVIAVTLAMLIVVDEFVFIFAHDAITRFVGRSLPVWLPARVVGPFLAYEIVALFIIRHRQARGRGMPTVARFANSAIETSLPTVILWRMTGFVDPAVAFGAWPTLLYFVYIVASTLRLDFTLPVFTGSVAAASFLGLAFWVLSPATLLANPAGYVSKAVMMLVAGLVAGLVALRLKAKFRYAVEQAAARDRVTNLFGQHVSPTVVDRLLASPADFAGETREVCVMFLDIRNFTASARDRRPEEVVEFLNAAFAFMIEAVDRHGGFINKFLGDGFMAIFGAPLDDPAAARHAVAAARDILAEIDRRNLASGPWPLKVGIGLHIGRAVTGNVGSPRRKEFTAIGDIVNLAARLEQLTKEHDARLIVSDAIVAALGADETATRLGTASVKGYAEPVSIWRLA